MEVPKSLRNLYQHFPRHISPKLSQVKQTDFDKKVFAKIGRFATERMRIWELKEGSSPLPYTEDPVLRDLRFCNIYRELDRQTIDIHRSLLPMRDDLSLWFLNILFQRFVCRPETIELVGLLSFDEKENKEVYERLIDLPRPRYGNAYVFPVSIIQKTEYPTREEFFCFELPNIAKKVIPEIENFDELSVVDAVEILCASSGYNFRFHFTECLIDLAYQFPEKTDLFKEFPIGPGSIPTMKSLSASDPVQTCLALSRTQIEGFPYLELEGEKVLLSVENWEGIGCEYRKYKNLSAGKGRRRKYNPG